MVFQQGDALADTLYALLLELLRSWRDGLRHMFHIRIVEQCTVNDTMPFHLIAGCATHLSVAYQHVITTCSDGLNTHSPQHEQHHLDKPVEGQSNLITERHIRQHQIVTVCIHAASPTLAPVHRDVMLTAVVYVHLALYQLISSENHTGFHLPHPETVVHCHMACYVFLHSQIKGKSPIGVSLRQIDVDHLLFSLVCALDFLQIYKDFM